MRKSFIIGGIIIALVGLGGILWLSWWGGQFTGAPAYSPKEMEEKEAKVASWQGPVVGPSQTTLESLDLSRPVRLAVGGLGLADDSQNGRLGDLILAELAGTPGVNLVERQSLALILKELSLNLSGLVRAGDAVRVGKLLKVDWFLLGTKVKLNGTNSLVIRVVDARTGVMRDAGVVPESKNLEKSAADVAAFVRQSRQNAALAKTCVYLAIGSFEDVGVNNRQADFSTQLHGYLMAAYQGSSVILLEREYVKTLLQEVHLDLASLAGVNDQQSPVVMQSAYWLVTGQYQSYETSRLELELNLDVQRIFGKTKHIVLRGQTNESICQQVKQEIDAAMNQRQKSLVLTRVSEARAQMAIGKELANLERFDLTYPNHYQHLDAPETARRRHNAEAAIAAFETVLLLDPGNREAKLYLAACLRKQTIGRVDEAREYYRNVLEEPVQDYWSELAQEALKIALLESGGTINWLHEAIAKSTNPAPQAFYQQHLNAFQTEAIIQTKAGPKAKELVEARLFEAIAANFQLMETGIGQAGGNFGMDDFVETFGTNQIAAGLRLAELYPKMKAEFPQLAPQLLEFVVTYQADTNSPLIGEVAQSLDWQTAHPNDVYRSKHFKCESQLFNWSMERKQYTLALKVMDRKLSVEGRSNASQLDDQTKIALGYAYQGMARWKEALEIFDSYSNRPIVMHSDGPWGAGWNVVLTGKQSNICRDKLGLPNVRDPREFDMGKPLMCLHTPSAFSADDSGLWIGTGGQLLQIGFNLETNLMINLPMETSTPITAICIAGTKILVATDGAGLIEFDKRSRKHQRFTIEDGLMINRIACLYVADNTLWIGYGYKPGMFGVDMRMAQNGGLGQMDLVSHKFISFMPSIANRPDATELNADNLGNGSGSNPPRRGVQTVAASPEGIAWFVTINDPLHCYRKDQNAWEGIPSIYGRSLAIDGERLFVGQPWNFKSSLGKSLTCPLGIHILNLKDGKWHDVEGEAGLPSAAVSALTIAGNQLWIGGMGYIAVMDATHEKILNFAYIHGAGVDHIQIAGGYVWAQFDHHLYRASVREIK